MIVKERKFPVILATEAMALPITKAEADAWLMSEIGRLPPTKPKLQAEE
jgi:hypothetical protein